MSIPSPPDSAPLPASILSQGPYLIVSVHAALDDDQLSRLQRNLIDEVGRQRSRGIVIDVAATRTLVDLGQMARLRGAETVVVGIAPEVAMAMVRLSLQTGFTRTALDLEEGLEVLSQVLEADPVVPPRGR